MDTSFAFLGLTVHAYGLCAAAEYTLREKDRAFAPPAGSENADAVRKLLEG